MKNCPPLEKKDTESCLCLPHSGHTKNKKKFEISSSRQQISAIKVVKRTLMRSVQASLHLGERKNPVPFPPLLIQVATPDGRVSHPQNSAPFEFEAFGAIPPSSREMSGKNPRTYFSLYDVCLAGSRPHVVPTRAQSTSRRLPLTMPVSWNSWAQARYRARSVRAGPACHWRQCFLGRLAAG